MNETLHVSPKELFAKAVVLISLLGLLRVSMPMAAAQGGVHGQRIPLEEVLVLVASNEASYVRYAAKDLAAYLTEISGNPVTVSTSADEVRKAKSVIAIGKQMALAMGADLGVVSELDDQESVIRSFDKAEAKIVIVAGHDPHATNSGIATLMQRIRSEGKFPYLEGPLDLLNKPSLAERGFHMNGGWPLNYPYGFRTWREEDWRRFVDIAWAQRVNLIFVWPYVETMLVPLSAEDEAYLQEFHRLVDYAQNRRGMEVWIMQSANRIAVSDCGVRDPRLRPYWISDCQKDMNPADPQQFANILKSFEALYRIVNNADAFCMIDSDPGGWPQSPLSDQAKIFNAARKLLDRYSVKGQKTKLVDWMWIGWGRHKYFTSSERLVTGFDWTEKNPDESDLAFMAETIRNFKDHLAEPWEMIAGMTPYLESSKRESALNKTIYLPYGSIELEPAFPRTNLGLDPVREVLDKAAEYPGLKGLMGNNQTMLLQFPRNYYFFNRLYDTEYKKHKEEDVLKEVSEQIYPDQKELLVESFLALKQTDPQKINITIARLEKLMTAGNAGRPGPLGRYVFPDQLIVARDLKTQLEIRAARQSLVKALRGKPDVKECARLVEDYFDKLLAWNKQTGWDKLIDIAIWTIPIYDSDKDFREALSRLKQVLGQGAPYTKYAQIDAFFEPIKKDLLKKYGENSVMLGCVEPFKLAVIRGQ
jgi:hypothetical protein